MINADLAYPNAGCQAIFHGWAARKNLKSHRRVCDGATEEQRANRNRLGHWPDRYEYRARRTA